MLARTGIIVVMAACAGCATAYQPSGVTGGFSERRISERSYEVNFRGNGFTTPAATRDGVIRRAAELTIASGFAAFTVAHDGSGVDVVTTSDAIRCRDQGDGTSRCRGGQTQVRNPYGDITIMMLTPDEAAATAASEPVYDAGVLLGQPPKIAPRAPTSDWAEPTDARPAAPPPPPPAGASAH